MGKSTEYLHTTGREKTPWCWGWKPVEVPSRAENLIDLFLLFSRLDTSTKNISHIKSWLSVDFVCKNLGKQISRVPYLLVTACTQLEILFEWTPRTTKDNYVIVTSNSTALLLEILSAPILRKLQQVCCMKRKTKEMILATWGWESKSATFYFLRTNCLNYWVKISYSKRKNFWAWMTVHHQHANCRICKAYLSATVHKHKCRLGALFLPFCLHSGFITLGLNLLS